MVNDEEILVILNFFLKHRTFIWVEVAVNHDMYLNLSAPNSKLPRIKPRRIILKSSITDDLVFFSKIILMFINETMIGLVHLHVVSLT